MEQPAANQHLEKIVNDHGLLKLERLFVCHVAWAPFKHKLKVQVHDGETWYRAGDQEPIIGAGVWNKKKYRLKRETSRRVT